MLGAQYYPITSTLIPSSLSIKRMWVTSPHLLDRPFTFSLTWHQILGRYLKTFKQNLFLYCQSIQTDSGHPCICNWRYDAHRCPWLSPQDDQRPSHHHDYHWMGGLLLRLDDEHPLLQGPPIWCWLQSKKIQVSIVKFAYLKFIEIIGTNSTSAFLEGKECFNLLGYLDVTSASYKAIVVKKVD